MRRHPDQQLMQQPGKHKNKHLRQVRRHAPAHERTVDMPLHKLIHGLIPAGPVRANGRAIPPVAVELAVAKAHNLREGVHEGLKQREEACQPAHQTDGAELNNTLEDVESIELGNFLDAVLNCRTHRFQA